MVLIDCPLIDFPFVVGAHPRIEAKQYRTPASPPLL